MDQGIKNFDGDGEQKILQQSLFDRTSILPVVEITGRQRKQRHRRKSAHDLVYQNEDIQFEIVTPMEYENKRKTRTDTEENCRTKDLHHVTEEYVINEASNAETKNTVKRKGSVKNSAQNFCENTFATNSTELEVVEQTDDENATQSKTELENMQKRRNGVKTSIQRQVKKIIAQPAANHTIPKIISTENMKVVARKQSKDTFISKKHIISKIIDQKDQKQEAECQKLFDFLAYKRACINKLLVEHNLRPIKFDLNNEMTVLEDELHNVLIERNTELKNKETEQATDNQNLLIMNSHQKEDNSKLVPEELNRDSAQDLEERISGEQKRIAYKTIEYTEAVDQNVLSDIDMEPDRDSSGTDAKWAGNPHKAQNNEDVIVLD